jgi:hypothetical protein
MGCAVGGATARFVVPPANAQQQATLTKWEYFCVDEMNAEDITPKANQLGAQYWELSAAAGLPGYKVWCFKRPAMGGYPPPAQSRHTPRFRRVSFSAARLKRKHRSRHHRREVPFRMAPRTLAYGREVQPVEDEP